MTVYILRQPALYRHHPVINAALRPDSVLGGEGYLAGESPYGLVTKNNIPASAEVRAIWRGRGRFDSILVGKTVSSPDGSWRIEGLNPKLRYDVVARMDGYNDLIMSNVQPVNHPRISKPVTMTIGQPVNIKLPVKGGVGTVTASASSLPGDVVLSGGRLVGQWPTGTPGESSYTISLTDDNGTYQSALVVNLVLLPLELSGSVPTYYMLGEEIEPITFSAYGGEGPYTFSIIDGDLPSGLDFTDGVLTGEPDTEEICGFVVQVEDSRGTKVQVEYSVEVYTPPPLF